jgi:hypothetical protein
VTKGTKIVFFKHEPITENVIKMAVCIQQQNRFELFFFDQVRQFDEFIPVITSAINYGTIT